MIKRLAPFRQPILSARFSSSKHDQNKSLTLSNRTLGKIGSAIQLPSSLTAMAPRISELFLRLEAFRLEFPVYLKLALSQSGANSSINLLAHLCRVCLIAESLSYIKNQQYYGALKKSIRKSIANIPQLSSNKHPQPLSPSSSAQPKLIPISNITPYSASLLMQFLSISKWEGDEFTLVDQLCSYYENYISLFTIKQEILFWNSYVNIMAKKVHQVSKFRKMSRLAHKVLEYCDVKDIIQSSHDTSNINRKIIKQLKYENQKELSIRLTINQQLPDIILRIKQMPDLNQYMHHMSDEHDNENQLEMRKVLTDQTKQLSSHIKKGWQLVILLDDRQSEQRCSMEQGKQKYVYQVKKVGDLEYVGTEKVQPEPTVDEHNLNSKQSIQSLKTSPKYISAIYYTSLASQSSFAIIHTVLTLLLSIPSSLLNSASFNLLVLSPYSASSRQHIASYITMPQLHELLPLCALQQRLTSIIKNFGQTASTIAAIAKQQKIQHYGLQEIANEIQSTKMSKEQTVKYLAKFNNIWTEMTINNIDSLRVDTISLDNQVFEDYQQFLPGIANYQHETLWQCTPFFNETVRIMEHAEQLRKKAEEDQQKNVKIKILCSKRKIPYLTKHILNAKFMTVPKVKPTSQQEAGKKQEIIQQLFKKVQHKL